jgi:FkbM family methyltransferase
MATLLDQVVPWLIPLARSYIRYFPLAAGKQAFWSRVVNPYLAWQPHRFVAPTRFGSWVAGNTCDILQQYIYYFGVWEPHLTRWMRRRLAPGDVFIDVGANIGYFSLLASKLVGRCGRVVAVEASPRIFRELKANLARNGARNVRAVNAAATHCRGTARVFQGDAYNCGLTTIVAEHGLAFDCEVEAAPLGELLAPDEVRRARLIKIDVEGAEWSVVAGLAPLLAAARPDLEVIVEVDGESLARQGKSTGEVVSVFARAGFHVYALENDYKALSYLAPAADKRPERIRPPLEGVNDVVFSRRDADSL